MGYVRCLPRPDRCRRLLAGARKHSHTRRPGSPGRVRALLRSIPDNTVKHQYDILFGEGDFTAFVTPFTGTFAGPLELPDGTVIEPTGESFEVMFSTIARWRDGKSVEEYLKDDNASFMQQIGLA